MEGEGWFETIVTARDGDLLKNKIQSDKRRQLSRGGIFPTRLSSDY